MINILSAVRPTPDLCKNVSLAIIFFSNGNLYSVSTQSDMYVHIFSLFTVRYVCPHIQSLHSQICMSTYSVSTQSDMYVHIFSFYTVRYVCPHILHNIETLIGQRKYKTNGTTVNVASHFGHENRRLVSPGLVDSIPYAPPCWKLKFLHFAHTVYVCFTRGSCLPYLLNLSSTDCFEWSTLLSVQYGLNIYIKC